jgi:hypothetical protein
MILIPHFLIGAAIGKTVPNIAFAIPLAFGSHIVLDLIPHWQETLYPYKPETKTWVRSIFEVLLILGIIYWLIANRANLQIIVCAFVGILPDMDSVFYLQPFKKLLDAKVLRCWIRFHEKIQIKETNKWWGLLPELVIIILSSLVIFK